MINTLPRTPMPMISTRKQVTVHCTLTLRKEDVSVSLTTSLTTMTVTNSDWFISIDDAHSNLPLCFLFQLCCLTTDNQSQENKIQPRKKVIASHVSQKKKFEPGKKVLIEERKRKIYQRFLLKSNNQVSNAGRFCVDIVSLRYFNVIGLAKLNNKQNDAWKICQPYQKDYNCPVLSLFIGKRSTPAVQSIADALLQLFSNSICFSISYGAFVKGKY
ncbi:hypothetical protein T11_10708 [Trichinella zimbabwensis]|uniref:Uncharacterized protein n=1 Tax=Trichinella zimbabwensis TaxID=268475 RepID=A0A0V1I949_9BILA|nr:hypothetical protein T11_10708 [Trichinella zimbabwensis]